MNQTRWIVREKILHVCGNIFYEWVDEQALDICPHCGMDATPTTCQKVGSESVWLFLNTRNGFVTATGIHKPECVVCDDTGYTVRYGDKEIGEPAIVRKTCYKCNAEGSNK